MRAVVQRVKEAAVTVQGKTVGSIGVGLLVLLAVELDDGEADVRFLSKKILNLRIFDDDQGKMNRSLLDQDGALLVISQFTLYGDCRKGNRPSFSRAAPPEQAERLYRGLLQELRSEVPKVEAGRFRSHMQVTSVNDGPVTLIVDSRPTV